MSTKNCNDTIGNRNRDLPACSAVPQPTVPPSTSNTEVLTIVVVVVVIFVVFSVIIIIIFLEI
jgi:hypothetical protein